MFTEKVVVVWCKGFFAPFVFKYFGIYVTMKKKLNDTSAVKKTHNGNTTALVDIFIWKKNTNGDYVVFCMDDSAHTLNQGARYDTTHDPHSI